MAYDLMQLTEDEQARADRNRMAREAIAATPSMRDLQPSINEGNQLMGPGYSAELDRSFRAANAGVPSMRSLDASFREALPLFDDTLPAHAEIQRVSTQTRPDGTTVRTVAKFGNGGRYDDAAANRERMRQFQEDRLQARGTQLQGMTRQASDRVRDAILGQRRDDAQMKIMDDQARRAEDTKMGVATLGFLGNVATAGGQTEAARVKALHDYLGTVATAGAASTTAQAQLAEARAREANKVTPVQGGAFVGQNFVASPRDPNPVPVVGTTPGGKEYVQVGNDVKFAPTSDFPVTGDPTAPSAAAQPQLVRRTMADGRVALFDPTTKAFVRFE